MTTDTRPTTTTRDLTADRDTQAALVQRLRALLTAEQHHLDVLNRQIQQLAGNWQRRDLIPAQRTQGHETPQGGAR